MDSNKLIITEDDGTQKEMEIVFTFDDDERGKSYVLFTDPSDEEGNVFVCSYDEEGQMFPVDDEKEFEMCNEVLGAFLDEEEDGTDQEA